MTGNKAGRYHEKAVYNNGAGRSVKKTSRNRFLL